MTAQQRGERLEQWIVDVLGLVATRLPADRAAEGEAFLAGPTFRNGGVRFGGTAIRIQVTAEDIAACAVVPDVGEGFQTSHPDGKDPVELAIARVSGQDTMCDEDGPGQEIATLGQGATTLVTNLPAEVGAWIDRYYKGQAVEPFTFDLVIEEWLVALIARAASIDELAVAVLNTEARG